MGKYNNKLRISKSRTCYYENLQEHLAEIAPNFQEAALQVGSTVTRLSLSRSGWEAKVDGCELPMRIGGSVDSCKTRLSYALASANKQTGRKSYTLP